MKVTLIEYTGKGRLRPTTSLNPDYIEDIRGENAMDILIYTKSTRLNMTPGLLAEIAAWPFEKKMEELSYMANTVPSSWEFVHYTFMIEGVTRAFTHQLVRTRTASYAQQAMRVLNMGEGKGWDFDTGPTIAEDPKRMAVYTGAMIAVDQCYKALIEDGAAVQDARGILPTNILTNIAMSINMRNFADLARKRSSPRVQDEYRSVLEAMKEAVREVHPWISVFIDRDFDNVALELCNELTALTQGCGNEGLTQETATKLIKYVDLLRAKS